MNLTSCKTLSGSSCKLKPVPPKKATTFLWTTQSASLQQLSFIACVSDDVLDFVFVFCGACEIPLKAVFSLDLLFYACSLSPMYPDFFCPFNPLIPVAWPWKTPTFSSCQNSNISECFLSSFISFYQCFTSTKNNQKISSYYITFNVLPLKSTDSFRIRQPCTLQ